MVPQGGRADLFVPLIAPAMLLGHAEAMPILADIEAPKGYALIHETQTFQRARIYEPEQDLELKFSKQRAEAGIELNFGILHDGEMVGGMQSRLRIVPQETMAALKGSKFPERLNGPNVTWHASSRFGKSVVEEYLRLSGDPNPIHRDDAAAQAAGLAKAVVPGMMIAGILEYIIGPATVAEQKIRFMAPVYVGQSVRLGVLKRDGGLRRVFVVRADGVLAAIADITLGLEQATLN